MAQFQTGANVLLQDLPQRAIFPAKNYTSTSDAVLSKRQIELNPVNDIATSAGDQIQFVVSSDTAFIDFMNSYIRGTYSFQKTGAETSLVKDVIP